MVVQSIRNELEMEQNTHQKHQRNPDAAIQESSDSLGMSSPSCYGKVVDRRQRDQGVQFRGPQGKYEGTTLISRMEVIWRREEG